jgi:hypothetical protein
VLRRIHERSCNRCMKKHVSEDYEGAKRDGWSAFSLCGAGEVDLCPACTVKIAKAIEAPKAEA